MDRPTETGDDQRLRSFVEQFIRFETTAGNERPAQQWFAEQLAGMGLECCEWYADPAELATHPSFPDDPDAIDVAGRPSVAGVAEFGNPESGPTLVLNGHADVVPAAESSWSSDPFEPTWSEDGDRLTARGAVDMKAALAACVLAVDRLRESAHDLDGRVVVESVAGEEDGGIGAAAAALSNPYPFERDAAIVAEPTGLRPVIATEGTVMKRLRLEGRSAHAAMRWRGESVLPHFRHIHDAFLALERERAERVTHPLYERFENPWPVNVGVVRAGNWASSVPADLVAEIRIGVAPGESVDSVEREFHDRLDSVVADSEWLSTHPPTFERFSVQFEPAEVDADKPVVRALRETLREHGLDDEPVGATYGADSRHYVEAGIPTVVFGPGRIEQAHYPDETVEWNEVLTAVETIANTAERFLLA